jgi:hypothetical protein
VPLVALLLLLLLLNSCCNRRAAAVTHTKKSSPKPPSFLQSQQQQRSSRTCPKGAQQQLMSQHQTWKTERMGKHNEAPGVEAHLLHGCKLHGCKLSTHTQGTQQVRKRAAGMELH